MAPLWSQRSNRCSTKPLRDGSSSAAWVSLQDQAAWVADLQQTQASARRDGGPSQALVYLYGYNVGFEDAAIQAAQIGFDLKVPGATAFFRWPSKDRAGRWRTARRLAASGLLAWVSVTVLLWATERKPGEPAQAELTSSGSALQTEVLPDHRGPGQRGDL